MPGPSPSARHGAAAAGASAACVLRGRRGACPGDRAKVSAVPSFAATRSILVVQPPRDLPMACGRFFGARPSHRGGPSRGRCPSRRTPRGCGSGDAPGGLGTRGPARPPPPNGAAAGRSWAGCRTAPANARHGQPFSATQGTASIRSRLAIRTFPRGTGSNGRITSSWSALSLILR